MTTVSELISLALVDAGVIGQGQTASGNDTINAFRRLNFMMAQWARKRWLVYHLIDVAFTSTGALSYTVGTGGNFNTPRPDKLESAFFRQLIPSVPNQVDYPLEIIAAREDYNRIALKSLGTWPMAIFYDSGYPLGSVYVWPVPAASLYQIHLSLKAPLGPFTGLDQVIVLPPEYEGALHYNLVMRLRAAYQQPVDPVIAGLAQDGLAVLRGSNVQIPRLQIPGALRRGSSYSVWSDQGS